MSNFSRKSPPAKARIFMAVDIVDSTRAKISDPDTAKKFYCFWFGGEYDRDKSKRTTLDQPEADQMLESADLHDNADTNHEKGFIDEMIDALNEKSSSESNSSGPWSLWKFLGDEAIFSSEFDTDRLDEKNYDGRFSIAITDDKKKWIAQSIHLFCETVDSINDDKTDKMNLKASIWFSLTYGYDEYKILEDDSRLYITSIETKLQTIGAQLDCIGTGLDYGFRISSLSKMSTSLSKMSNLIISAPLVRLLLKEDFENTCKTNAGAILCDESKCASKCGNSNKKNNFFVKKDWKLTFLYIGSTPLKGVPHYVPLFTVFRNTDDNEKRLGKFKDELDKGKISIQKRPFDQICVDSHANNTIMLPSYIVG